MNKKIVWFLLCYAGCCSADVTLIRPLDFGKIAVLDNSTVKTFTMDRFGQVDAPLGTVVLSPGSQGIVEITGYPPGLELNIVASIIQPISSVPVGTGETFTLTNIDIANAIQIPFSGVAQLSFGGTLSTSGSGSVNFTNTLYTHRLRLDINF